MDLLEQPEVKSAYEKCKYVVKLWEHNFKKTKGRLPSKFDIREADRKVREAYREYYRLKTAALEQSFKDIDGFNSDEETKANDSTKTSVILNNSDTTLQLPEEINAEDTWGLHLNKKVEETKKVKNGSEPSVSKKLFCGSKLSKRYSRKSVSFSQKKSESSFDNSFVSQLTLSSAEKVTSTDANLSFEGLFSDNVKVVKVIEQSATQSTNVVQSVLENKYKSLKTVDTGWLERVGQKTGVPIEKVDNFDSNTQSSEISLHLDYNSDDIIDNSDDENSLNLGHCTKKTKLDVNFETNVINENQNKLVEVEKEVKKTVCHKQNEDPYEFVDDVRQNVTKVSKKTKKAKILKDRNELKSETPRTKRAKAPVNLAESHSEDEDPFHSDTDPNDPEFSIENHKDKLMISAEDDEPKINTKKIRATKKNKKTLEKNNENTDIEEEESVYELEYSVKPRVSAPRVQNLKTLIRKDLTAFGKDDIDKSDLKMKNKQQQQLEKLEKKIESGTLNENFVTINLRKKIYSRGKKNMNFSKYKKKQWKEKKKTLAGPDMDMGGCDGGMLTCFNCGDIGHFARHCPKLKGDTLLPLEAATEDESCPFPTLEEASQMAKGSALVVRKPNFDSEAQDDENETLEQIDDDDNDIFNDGDTEGMLAEALKLEDHIAKLDLQMYMDTVSVVEPYYKTKEGGLLIGTPDEVFKALQKFGHSSFRPGQEEAVMRILSGKSTLVTLSTGSGKSLCYQLPAYLYSQREPCISLIISPLVSLMEDQVTGIPSFLRAACLHTNQTKTQRQKVMEAMNSGLLNVLLVSPEAVVAGEKQTGFGSLLRKLPPIAFACIDEAHCVSQWSHNFRPSYLLICRVLRERLGVRTVLGLTATATRSTCDSIISHLQIPDGRNGVISDIPLPDNLILTVSKDHDRDRALLALLLTERFSSCRSIIIYCTRREECNRLSKFLRTSLQYSELPSNSKKRKRVNVQVEPYHAGLTASRRKTIQKTFMSGELRIVVATVAFGMGINKSDIRAVIHYNMPKNFESYVQEVGRAGRDGLPAHCHVFLDAKGSDENELRRHIYANSIDRHVIRKLLQRIFVPCSCKNICPKHEVAFSIEETVKALDIPEENISTLLCYLELHEKKYIELLSPAYTICKVISYGGPMQIRKAAKECPPLAMALALNKNSKKNEQNIIEFAVVDVAAMIGWDSGICKHKLKNLEWETVNGMPKRSALTVRFSNLGFRLLAPGNLTDEQLDEALDSLHEHVLKQEKTSLLQLRAIHQTLVQVASPSYKSCLTQDLTEVNIKLKSKIREYFESPNPLDSIHLTENKIVDEELIVNNIRGLLSTYRDNNFSGRAVARIFHGIASPNYPAVIWGRCKYWRSHISVDFNLICKLATKEILNFR